MRKEDLEKFVDVPEFTQPTQCILGTKVHVLKQFSYFNCDQQAVRLQLFATYPCIFKLLLLLRIFLTFSAATTWPLGKLARFSSQVIFSLIKVLRSLERGLKFL